MAAMAKATGGGAPLQPPPEQVVLAVAARHWRATHAYRSGLLTPLPAALRVVTIEARQLLLSVSGGGCLCRRRRCRC